MLKRNPGTREAQLVRLDTKTQDNQLVNAAIHGTGMSPWEAELLVDTVRDVYFSLPGRGTMRSGQMLWTCVALDQPHGKPLKDCSKTTVVLTINSPEDLKNGRGSAAAIRRLRLSRIAEEAIDQDGCLSQEDLAAVLSTDVRTIRRDIAWFRKERDLLIRTRGTLHDIGPGITHREKSVSLWLAGQEPVEVARNINHTLKAVERYLQHFCRCVFLHRKGFTPLQTSMTIGLSSAATKRYLALYDKAGSQGLSLRLDEIDATGSSHYHAEDQKKGAPSSNKNSNAGRLTR